jgi:hypothetical protein
MNEQELRALVREAVARRLGGGAAPAACSPAPALITAASTTAIGPHAGHASHGLYVNLVNIGDACVIEPAVNCDHCGYCRSHGH